MEASAGDRALSQPRQLPLTCSGQGLPEESRAGDATVSWEGQRLFYPKGIRGT